MSGHLSLEESAVVDTLLRHNLGFEEMPQLNHTVLGLLSVDQPPLVQRLIHTFAGFGDEAYTKLTVFRWDFTGGSLAWMQAPSSSAHAFQIGVSAPGEPDAKLGLAWNEAAGEPTLEPTVFARRGDGDQTLGSFPEFLRNALEAAAHEAHEHEDVVDRDVARLALFLGVLLEGDPRLDGMTL